MAFKKGYDINRATASASFKVIEDNKTVKPFSLPSDFTKSKREEGVIVQKREKRISSFGEKFDITRRGIESRRLI